MNDKDEMLVIAERALRNIRITAKEACDENKLLSPTLMIYMAEYALKQMQMVKQKTR